jgi:uncharacterized membrane protein
VFTGLTAFQIQLEVLKAQPDISDRDVRIVFDGWSVEAYICDKYNRPRGTTLKGDRTVSTTHVTSIPSIGDRPEIRRITELDLDWALSEGWQDFKDKRGELIPLALIYPFVGILAAFAMSDSRVLPLFFPLVAGISIFGPAVASGFCELARRREAGLDSTWIHFLDPLRGRSRFGLAILTFGLAALLMAWLLSASLIYGATIGVEHPVGFSEFVRRLFTTPQGWAMVLVGNLVGFAFAVVTLTLSLVSFPMVVDKSVDPMTAITTSVRAVTLNPKAAASWGLRVATLLVLGSLPLFVGLAIVLPVLGYATWHLYTRLVAR